MKAENQTIEFTRVNNDVNGNPRYVCHFFELLTQSEIYSGMSIDQQYKLGVKRANKLGGRKFIGKEYGGGIVFQIYSGEAEKMTQLINELKNN